MTARDVIRTCEQAGVTLALDEHGRPRARGANAALIGLLRAHRTEVIRLLGGDPEPERCPGYEYRFKKDGQWVSRTIFCASVVKEAEDTPEFCPARTCPFRLRCRGGDGEVPV